LKLAGVKTWGTFDRGTTTWDFQEHKGVYKIIGHRKRPYRGWEQGPDQIEILPPGSGVEATCERMVEILQAKARE
jgi:hypothetical protein